MRVRVGQHGWGGGPWSVSCCPRLQHELLKTVGFTDTWASAVKGQELRARVAIGGNVDALGYLSSQMAPDFMVMDPSSSNHIRKASKTEKKHYPSLSQNPCLAYLFKLCFCCPVDLLVGVNKSTENTVRTLKRDD